MFKIHINDLRNATAKPRAQSTLAADLNAVGCFLISGCLDPELVDRAHGALEKLFSKSESEKTRCAADKQKDPLATGFSPYGVARALDTRLPNLLETWDISPDQLNWPKDMIPEWQLFTEYQRSLYNVAIVALEFVTIILGIDRRGLLGLVHPANGGIHFIHYFPVPREFPPGARRQSEHCDNTLVTLIPAPNPVSSGLAVFDRQKHCWEDILIQKDECLVQAGLLLERITFRTIRANLHTVRNPQFGSPENVSRFSTPFFLSPGKEVLLRILPEFRSEIALKEFPDIPVVEAQAGYFSKIFGKD